MAMPPKKKYKSRPSKVQQAASDQATMKKILNFSIVLLLLPALFFGVKQVNPGIFYTFQGAMMERFNSHTAAARAYENAFNADPAKNIGALLQAARINEYLENWEAVEELSRKILDNPLSTTGQKAGANLHMAWRAYAQERYEDAFILAEAAQRGTSTMKDYQYRSWVCIGAASTKINLGNMDKLKQSWDALDTAIKQKRMFAAEAHYYMGVLYEAWKNQKAEALDEYDYGLSQSPTPKMREKLLAGKSRVVTS